MTPNKPRISRTRNIATLSSPDAGEHCITVHNDGHGAQSLLAIAKDHRASIVSQSVFAGCQHHDQKMDPQVLWLQGDACQSGEILSTQATAVSGLDIDEVVFNGQTVGVTYETEHARYCRLNGLTPDDLHASREEQTKSLLENTQKALQGKGFQFNDTVRTWCYLDHLCQWYDEFNRERTAFYEKQGVFDKMVPASTGIGAANASGAAIAVSLLAVQPKNDKMTIETVSSPLQKSPIDYGSAFSRALELSLPTHRTLYISGTASVDKSGKTVYADDPEKQISQTMRVIEALLQSRGMDWHDLFRGIAYFKNMDHRPLFDAYCQDKKIADFPLAISHADICRDDLLFEIELDAIKINE